MFGPKLIGSVIDSYLVLLPPQSRDKSEGNREGGNSSFYSGNYRQALILYSIAVFTAPQDDGTDCFALALANRDRAFISFGN